MASRKPYRRVCLTVWVGSTAGLTVVVVVGCSRLLVVGPGDAALSLQNVACVDGWMMMMVGLLLV